MKIKKKWEDLKICDDFMFAKVMRNKDICKEIIEKVLKIKIDKIEYLEEQKTIDIKYDAKSIRLDVYIKDEKNTVYNVEVQTTNQYNLAKRSRYYQGLIDLDLIEKGEIYNNLNRSYVIFICTFDPFKRDRHIYTFRNICEEDKELYLEDETTKIFLNSKGTLNDVDKDIKAFLDYVSGEISNNGLVKRVDSEVSRIKRNEEWKVEYMTLLMKEREIAWEAKEEEREQGICNLIESYQEIGATPQQTANKVSEKYSLSKDDVKEKLNKYWKR